MSELLERLDQNNIPKHIAVIMDGNGRWAKQQGEDRTFGHISGVKGVREALIGAKKAGVQYLTLYAFSTENWNRPKDEVDALMDLLVTTIANEVETLNENGVRLNVIGDVNNLPGSCQQSLEKAMEQTKENDKLVLTLALNYSSRWEIVDAAKKIAAKVKNNELEVDEINIESLSAQMNTKDMPDPELLIRTSGETRISNFMLWQLAYTELIFIPILWPDFKQENFFEAILHYQKKERRFGMTSEQINQTV